MQIAYIVIYIFTFAVGAAVGSFLDVLIYRLPRGLGFVKSFSFCSTCSHRLLPWDLVPIFSYLVFGRKCRFCGKLIPSRRMKVEFMCGILTIVSWTAFLPPVGFLAHTLTPRTLVFPDNIDGQAACSTILYISVLSCLLVIAWIDHETMEIPDSLNIAIAVCGVFAVFIGPDVGLKSHLIGIAVAAVPLFVIAIFIEGAFGFGDVKLMAAAGLFLGWQNCLVALFTGIIIGGIQGVVLLISKRKGSREHFAFGPALCIGIGIAMFMGDKISNWYFLY